MSASTWGSAPGAHNGGKGRWSGRERGGSVQHVTSSELAPSSLWPLPPPAADAPARARQGRAGQGRAGQGRAGQGRAGQGRAGQGRAGQGRAGQGRTWREGRDSGMERR
ncbi:unnamed protein product [Closterium sp. NIES-64]|nr:unnamed protein product [Closterium sp. NIES-64]